jgi:hypothetical protein
MSVVNINRTDWYRTGLLTNLNVCLVKLYLYPLTVAAVAMLFVHTVWALGNTTTFEWSRSKHVEYLQGRRVLSRSRFRWPVLDWPFSRGIRQNLSYFCLGSSQNENDNVDSDQQVKVVAGGDSLSSLSSSLSRGKKATTVRKPTIWQPPRRSGRK